jgi:hypothetical protein
MGNSNSGDEKDVTGGIADVKKMLVMLKKYHYIKNLISHLTVINKRLILFYV